MKLLVFSIYDVQAEVYQKPFFCLAEGEARRAFVDIIGDPKSALGQHPEDYSLVIIGSYNDNSGLLASVVCKTLLTGREAWVQNRQTTLPGMEGGVVSASDEEVMEERARRDIDNEGKVFPPYRIKEQ